MFRVWGLGFRGEFRERRVGLDPGLRPGLERLGDCGLFWASKRRAATDTKSAPFFLSF